MRFVIMPTEAQIMARRNQIYKEKRANAVPRIPIPTKPLIDYMETRYETDYERGVALGGTHYLYRQLKRRQTINWITGDRYAVSMGIHPVLIWRDWYEITTPKKCA